MESTKNNKVKHTHHPNLSHHNHDFFDQVWNWNQGKITLKVTIKGDQKVHILDGITQDMYFEDIFTIFSNTCDTKYSDTIL